MSLVEFYVTLTLRFSIFTLSFCDRDQVRRLASELCPFNKFCHADAKEFMRPDTEREPCCKPCFCDDDCWILDNCCPDKELMNEPRPSVVPCIDSYLSQSDDSNPDNGFYRVIDSCPGPEDASYLESKCDRNNRASVEDLIWVSDKTGRIYQNIHCAKCHGINDTIPWQIQTTCYDIMKVNFENLMGALLSKNCNMVNTVPKDLEHTITKYKCYIPSKLKYTSCNATGLMTHYDSDIEAACEQSTWPLDSVDYMSKNAFCVLCNEDLPVPTPVYLALCSIGGRQGDASSITFLIDYESVLADNTDKGISCGLDEIFDAFMGFCRKLRCPIGTAPLYGRCKQLVSKINGLIINVQYYLDVIWSKFGDVTDYGSSIYTHFMKLLDLNKGCYVCQKILDVTEGNESASDLVLVISIEFEEKCNYSLALTKLSDVRGKVFDVYADGLSLLMLLVRSDEQPTPLISGPSLQTIFHHKPHRCNPDYALLFEDMICPWLELNYTELELIPEAKNKEKLIFASFFWSSLTQQNLPRVSVCLKKYITMLSLNCAVPSDGKMTLKVLPAILFVLTVNQISCH